MAIRESGSIDSQRGRLVDTKNAALWQRRNARTTAERREDRGQAITRTLAASSDPSLLFGYIGDDAGRPR